ncbi:26S proteasome non-ATPase regulatory subunit 3 [Galemys pyrenaicus]|uniref:26S proteasome non-ATPase regulatory subunit 3 n=1 Tax=Galemys pyrenaicus TaxID=202257 RepID=A0A8J6ANG9_GALPY|nr:26S proteasome non-ATPase regulatory subunit 3 [Galemys pyrenaicus]
MKQEGSARRRGADKAKPPPGGGEQEPPPPAAPQDVEMKEEAAAAGGSTGEADGKAATTAAEHSQRELDTVTLEDIKEHVKQLEKAVSGKEPRFVLRALRMLPSTSRRLNHYVLYKAVHGFFTSNNATRDFLLPFLEEPMDTEADLQFRPRTGKAASTPLLPEVEAYLQLLMVIFLMNSKRYKEAQKVSDDLMQKISTQNRRALDLVAAKCYYYHARVYEFLDKLDVVRSFLHARLRTATLRHDADGQATLLNLLLRNYLHYSLYDQAEKLVSKSVFPEQANNNEWARYLYYTGRIKAIQLEYSEARRTMTNALRKAPQHTAVGFKQTLTAAFLTSIFGSLTPIPRPLSPAALFLSHNLPIWPVLRFALSEWCALAVRGLSLVLKVHKLLIVVELLLGEIPDRLQFRQPSLKRSLMPYFLLTQAVRTGNLAKFNQVLDQFGEKFQADGTYTLIIRLRHNVIKTGVRMISLSYSRISLADIAQKLQLDSPEDAEFIVAKAIRDGVIEASINHEKGYVQSKEMIDIYSTREPQLAFHQRISFCLDIHNMSVKVRSPCQAAA